MNDKTDSLCRICNQPVNLTFDTATDEDGQAVHDLCYVRKIAAHQGPPEQPDPQQPGGPSISGYAISSDVPADAIRNRPSERKRI
jgi:hypothetical protein